MNFNCYHFNELQKTNPKEIIHENNNLKDSFLKSLSVVDHVFKCAEEFLTDYFGGKDFSFPIPVRELAQQCNFLIFEEEMADLDSMETDPKNGGGRTTIAQIQMRERRFTKTPGEIAGTIRIDKNLSEYSKRFAIAHELGHYVLRTQNPIGPLFIEDSCPGSFAYVREKEFLANEFAYALLLPYSLVAKRKAEYEIQNQYNPLDYMDWITVLKDEAQMPEHHVILAYEEIKKYHFACVREKEEQEQEDVLNEINAITETDTDPIYDTLEDTK